MSDREPRFGLSLRDLQRIITTMLSENAEHRRQEAQSLASHLPPNERPNMEATIEFRDMDEDEWLEAVRLMALKNRGTEVSE